MDIMSAEDRFDPCQGIGYLAIVSSAASSARSRGTSGLASTRSNAMRPACHPFS
jgi:hypothetical protein